MAVDFIQQEDSKWYVKYATLVVVQPVTYSLMNYSLLA
jgi:hypothetical protein